MNSRLNRTHYRSRSRAIAAALLVLIGPAPALAADLGARIAAALRLPDSDRTVVGAHIVELPSGRVVYASRADQPFKPASNMKLLTTAAALDILTPDYLLRTTLAIHDNNLVLIGGGDPLLGDEETARTAGQLPTAVFREWAVALRRDWLAREFEDVVYDDFAFDQQWTHPSWPADQLQQRYAAPVGALNFFDNVISVRVGPETEPQYPVRYMIIPTDIGVTIENRCVTGTKGSPLISRRANEPVFILHGGCELGAAETVVGPVSYPDPGRLAAGAFLTEIRIQGITASYDIRRERIAAADGSLPNGAIEVAAHHQDILDVIRRANTDSLNLAAEALFKALGRIGPGGPKVPAWNVGSWTTGRETVLAWLGRNSLARPELVIADGSGLSHDNRLTPALLTGVLTHMFNGPYREYFLASLSRSGETGTLAKRLGNMPGRVLGKTGYLDGVRTLSGYIQADDGTWLAFSILHNGFKGGSAPYKKAQDDVCRILAEYKRAQ